MPIVLSLSDTPPTLWAAGPDGLFRHDVDELSPVAQPQAELTACLAIGDHLLVGGAPYGVAFSSDGGQDWQQSYAAGELGLALCFAVAPDVAESGTLLTGTDGASVWRSRDLGRSWSPCHVGLSDSSILCLEWAPPAPAGRWPAWEMVFAGGERGVFRSPNGGRAWKAGAGINCVVQCLATGPDFQHTGEVLAGSEGDGLWRSTDAGRTFEPVPDTPAQINALTAHAGGWILSDETGLWRSPDGLTWQRLPETEPALVLLATPRGLFAGGMQGVRTVS
jgi:hypothetical protein